MRRHVEEGIKDSSLLKDALNRVAKQESIPPNDPVIQIIVEMAKYFPELNYLGDYTDDAELIRSIQVQLDTRPEAFLDELIVLLGK